MYLPQLELIAQVPEHVHIEPIVQAGKSAGSHLGEWLASPGSFLFYDTRPTPSNQ